MKVMINNSASDQSELENKSSFKMPLGVCILCPFDLGPCMGEILVAEENKGKSACDVCALLSYSNT